MNTGGRFFCVNTKEPSPCVASPCVVENKKEELSFSGDERGIGKGYC